MAAAEEAHLFVPPEFRRNALADEDATVRTIAYMCEHLGLRDLGNSDVLDFGCGVRFTEAFLNRNLALGRYVGVDVWSEMIKFLAANVTDPRFQFAHFDARNELYNPLGVALSPEMSLPIDGQEFDVICMFSVLTHMAPDDYVAMLRLLRRFVRPTGRLFFTVLIDERPRPPGSFLDAFLARGGSNQVKSAIQAHLDATPDGALPFKDLVPDRPLLLATYSKAHALELVDGTGWAPLSLSPPNAFAQYHIVCEPV